MTRFDKYRQVVREARGTGWALLALALVRYLTTRVFRDMELDDEEARHGGR